MKKKTDNHFLRFVLALIYAFWIVLLLPWLPIAVWCLVFIGGDPMPEMFDLSFVIGKVIPAFVLMYPIFIVCGMVSSWYALKMRRGPAVVLITTLFPLLIFTPAIFFLSGMLVSIWFS